MAFRLLSPLRSPFAVGLTLTTAYCVHSMVRPAPSQMLYCESKAGIPQTARGQSHTQSSLSSLAQKAPHSGNLYRQISGGSMLGLVAGLAVGTFSKPLAFLFGLLVFAIQFAESRGIHIIPYNRIQGYVKGINIQSTLERNPAFKLSFGIVFALCAFAPL